MEKNGDGSRSSTTETTISSGSLPLLGWRRARADFAALRRVEGLNRNELNRVAIAVAGIDDAGMPNVRNSHRDQRSRLQRRPHRFALASLVFFLVLLVVSAEPACASQPKIWEEFSGDKALAHVQRLVDLGPRPPGSEAIEKSRDYIENQLRLVGWQVRRQAFTDDTPRGKVRFVNLVARFPAHGSAGPSV